MKILSVLFITLTYIIGQKSFNLRAEPPKPESTGGLATTQPAKPDRKVIKFNKHGDIWLMNSPVKNDKFAEFNLGDSTSVLASKNSIISINRDVEVAFFNGVSMLLPPRIMLKIQDAFEKTIMVELAALTSRVLNLKVGDREVALDLKPMKPMLLVIATRAEKESVIRKDNALIIKLWDPILIEVTDKTPPMATKAIRIINVSEWVTLSIGGKNNQVVTSTGTIASDGTVSTTPRDQASPTKPD